MQTTIITQPDGSSALQITQAPVVPPSITLTQSDVQQTINDVGSQIANLQKTLTTYQGYLALFPPSNPNPVQTP